MFEPASRYAALSTGTIVLPDGRVAVYVRRRFLPRAADLAPLGEVTVAAGDRIDLVAARAVGDPEHYWRLCDANDTMHPDELVAEPGRALRVAAPQS